MADITKIQPIGSSTQYELGARYLTTGRTFQIKDNDATNAGPASSTFNGTANIVINLPSTIKASLTGNASTATKATQDSDGNQINTTYAKLATTNNFVHSTNEWTVVPSGYSGALWLNYRTCGGTNGNITQYNFGNGKGGVLASITNGTFNGNCTGSAGSVAWGNVTGKPSTFTPASHSHSYLPLSGGTVTGYTSMNNHLMCMTQTAGFGFTESGSALQLREVAGVCANQSSWHYAPKIGFHWGNRIARQLGMNADGWLCFLNQSSDTSFGVFKAGTVYGAVWNDYAECRNIPEVQKLMKEKKPAENYEEIKRDIPLAGYCVYEVGDDTMKLSTKRLQRGCKIISDTFGFNIGETKDAKTPIAVSGRVLAYCYEGREEARKHIGYGVCSGPDGMVSIMTEEEERLYPMQCIGTISSVPDYEVWGEENIPVNGRIWIYVK